MPESIALLIHHRHKCLGVFRYQCSACSRQHTRALDRAAVIGTWKCTFEDKRRNLILDQVQDVLPNEKKIKLPSHSHHFFYCRYFRGFFMSGIFSCEAVFRNRNIQRCWLLRQDPYPVCGIYRPCRQLVKYDILFMKPYNLKILLQ